MVTDNDRVHIFRDTAGDWRFRRVAGNNEIGAVGEAYTRRADAIIAAERWFPDVPRDRYEIDE